MTKLDKTTEAKHDKKIQQKQESFVQPEGQFETSPQANGLPEHLIFNSDLKRQANLLSNPNIPVIQRQAIASRIGSIQGNRHLQQLMDTVKKGRTFNTPPNGEPRIQQMQIPIVAIQRKGGGIGGGTATGTVGISGGESTTPSNVSGIASGYNKRADGQYDTPDKRVISETQAKDESKVIESDGIYIAAYLARYNHVKSTYSLPEAIMDKLSSKAGFLKQFQTGDIVLRLMDASDSSGIAKITDSQYSHTGIVQVKGGRVWVLDSYPRGVGKDSSILIRFEDFYADHHGEKIVNGLVLRISGISKAVRDKINKLIDKYELKMTTFDREFKIDNGEDVLYCSELVTRILREAGASTLPPNEFDATKAEVESLIGQLEFFVKLLKSQGQDASTQEAQLAQLRGLLSLVTSTSTNELFSPGSYERGSGFDTIAGFSRGAQIKGTFKVTVVSGAVPDQTWETPDPYVVLSGGIEGETSIKSDTRYPTWNKSFTGVSYDDLGNVTFEIKDSDVLFDDDIATIKSADIRPVKPSGQNFFLADNGAILTIHVENEDSQASVAGQGPRDLTSL